MGAAKRGESRGGDLLFKAALVMVACYLVYFSALLVSMYATFHEFSDTGLSVYGLYFNTHYPQLAHGLQLMEFDQHLSPDALFIMLLYRVFESPLTILLFQVAVTALTALIVLYATRELTRNGTLAFALCLAFLINPGTIGLLLFDTHIEFLIAPFYVLVLYYYLKGRPFGLSASLALLLGSADVAPYMALTLGAGLLLYELLYNRKRRLTGSRPSHALLIIAASVAAIGLYSLAAAGLASSYQSSYAGLPQMLHVVRESESLIGPSISGLLQNPVATLLNHLAIYAASYRTNLVYALILAAFGFGITLVSVPLIAVVLEMPWLGGAFVIGWAAFLFPTTEYFGYLVGPAVSAAILGAIASEGGMTYVSRLLKSARWDVRKAVNAAALALPVLLSVAGPAVYLLVYSPLSAYHTVSTGNLGNMLLLSPNATARAAYAQLDSAIAIVPEDASVMTEYFIMAHLAQRKSIETMTDTQYYFQPDCILVDLNKDINQNVCNGGFDNCTRLDGLLATGNYSLIYSNGTAMLYCADALAPQVT